jgi:hypothetical protein
LEKHRKRTIPQQTPLKDDVPLSQFATHTKFSEESKGRVIAAWPGSRTTYSRKKEGREGCLEAKQ